VRSHVWHTKSGKEVTGPEGGEWFAWVFAFAPDSKSIAGTTASGTLRTWNLSDGREIRAIGKVPDQVIALAYPEREKLLAVTSDGESVAAWDAIRGQRLHDPVARGPRQSLAISPDGKVFAFDAGKGTVSIRSVADGKELHQLTGHKQEARCLAFSADGGSLAVGSWDTAVPVWDVATGKERGRCQTGTVLPLAALSPDGKEVATGGPNHPHAALFWDAATGRLRNDVRAHTGPIYSLVFSPDGKQVATASWFSRDPQVRLWDAATGRPVREFTAHEGGVSGLAFSPDGQKLATSGWSFDRKVKIWDPATAKELHTFTGHEEGVVSLAFSPDGQRLASGDTYYDNNGSAGRVRVWALATGKQVRVLAAHKGSVQALTFDRGGTRLYVAADGVHTYDLASGKRVGEPLQPESRVWSLSLSPDEKVLLTVSVNEPARLCELATGQPIATRSVGGCTQAALSPGGRFIALGTKEAVRLFDRADGKECLMLRGIRGSVGALTFSPDGKVLAAAGSEDTSALLWDVSDLAKRPLPAAKTADADALDGWWEALKGDASAAERAAWALSARPDQAITRLKASLKPAREPDAKRVAGLIAELDDDNFETRERAAGDLEMLGETAAGQLREALKNKPTPEQRRRLEELIDRLKGGPVGGEWLRGTRAVAVLERIGTPEARELLQALARGAPDVALTQDAAAALRRLDKRKGADGDR
jgi:WD40 repeat protein